MGPAKDSTNLQMYIDAYALRARLIEKAPTESTAEAYAALRARGFEVHLDQFIKALVVTAGNPQKPTRVALVMVPGSNRVDLGTVGHLVGQKMRVPPPQDAARLCSYPRGGTPPFGATRVDTVIVDTALVAPARLLYGGGGDQEHVVEVHSEDLVQHLLEAHGASAVVVSPISAAA